ncbi:MAG: hypothetical protein E6Q43_04105 [Dokdonella sp.]|nr:MAG: hypothetical protein EYC71_04955 [Gammaproteobacteria bacterium]TXI74882.1 MAG: hypothetical protein E6Q43_04105 [Dokdonella sp.]
MQSAALFLTAILGGFLLVSIPALADEDISKVNGSIQIEEGRNMGDLGTVNGSIRVGANSRAVEVSSVNGSIEIESGAQVESADTVNGRISIGKQARVAQDMETVNGSLRLDEGSEVGADLSNVNGAITLRAAHVVGQISTVNGDIEIGADSRVDGGILVEKSNSWFSWSNSKPPRVVIGPRAVIGGSMVFQREVELHVSESAKVGKIEGATPRMFAGETP